MVILVKDVSFVDIFHNVCSNDCVKVSFHKIKYQIDIFVIFGFEYVKKGHNIWMTVEFLQENDLASKGNTSR